MTVHQDSIEVPTRGRGTHDISEEVAAIVAAAGIQTGTCQIFCQHTSASLLLTENADPDVRRDLESFMGRLAPDGDPIYRHTAEGPDDMSAHVRSVLTQSAVSLPVSRGHCRLGVWQGIYLWEHRTAGHRRTVVVTVVGD